MTIVLRVARLPNVDNAVWWDATAVEDICAEILEPEQARDEHLVKSGEYVMVSPPREQIDLREHDTRSPELAKLLTNDTIVGHEDDFATPSVEKIPEVLGSVEGATTEGEAHLTLSVLGALLRKSIVL